MVLPIPRAQATEALVTTADVAMNIRNFKTLDLVWFGSRHPSQRYLKDLTEMRARRSQFVLPPEPIDLLWLRGGRQ
jgi:hypothetical protein